VAWLVPAGRAVGTVLRDPVVVILLLAGAAELLAGDPLVDGLVLLTVAAALARDRVRGRPPGGVPIAAPGWADRLVRARPTPALVIGGLLYSVAAGGLARFSWPAMVAVAVPGVVGGGERVVRRARAAGRGGAHPAGRGGGVGGGLRRAGPLGAGRVAAAALAHHGLARASDHQHPARSSARVASRPLGRVCRVAGARMVPGAAMSSRAVTIAGYLLIVGCGVALELSSRRRGSPVPSFGALLRRVMRTRSGRVGVLVGWAWLGVHFLAR
jgi:hypothetical protein